MVFFFYFFPPIFSILILGKRAESGQNKNRKDGWGIYFFSMVWITNQQTNNPRFVIQAMDKEKKYSHQQDKQKIQITKQAWVICIFVCRWCPYFPPIINLNRGRDMPIEIYNGRAGNIFYLTFPKIRKQNMNRKDA